MEKEGLKTKIIIALCLLIGAILIYREIKNAVF
jgi:hypothetical protein